jgi:gliding motility-associated protein GldM
MALPKEPRQKMINIMYLVLTAILALNVSAEIINAFRTVDTSLTNSSTNLNKSNEVLYKSLEEKKNKAETAKQAAEWAPLAEKAKGYSAEMDNYINQLKADLKKEAGLRMVDGKEDFKADNLDASTRLFENQGKGNELKVKLDDFKKKMLEIHPEIKQQFEAIFPVNTDPIQSQEGGTKDFTQGYFHMTPTIAALTMLSKFQNNVKNAENQVVTYCHNKIGSVEVHLDQANLLVGQNSNYLMPGQELVVTAGVGAYSSKSTGNISFGGAGKALVGGVATYNTTVSGSGERSMEINGSFVGEDGKSVPVHQTIKYTVGVPGGAAVMLDKMNVFYIGVDNPITISSGSGWDKTSVSMAGGTMSGSGGSRVVTVTTPGTASITVTADGKSSKFDFRVKTVPDPIFKIGTGKPRMPSVEFKNQQFCRAELERFDFDTRFSIVSATVYFSGANFTNVPPPMTLNGNNLSSLAANIQRCGPGSNVTFENIKVSGPGGTRPIEGRSFALY